MILSQINVGNFSAQSLSQLQIANITAVILIISEIV